MFTQNRITVAARCCECCAEIETEISVFNLSGGKIRAVCPNCGKSALEITLSQDGKVRLSVPCVACPHPHPFTLSAETMFTKELFILQCSFTRLDICFMGQKNKVKEAMIKNGKELRTMMALGEEDDASADEEILSAEMYERIKVVLTFIEECANNGNITCKCRNNKTAPGIEVQLENDAAVLVCKECGRSVRIGYNDTDLLDMYIDMGKIRIFD
ncbi:MAG: hypothetical protein IKU43_11795 [Clostridia bacterium]|nr:hypothetical protein [Clostridia bacterium]